jgi:hypothetical protein
VSIVGKSLPTVGYQKNLEKDGLALTGILGIDRFTPTYFVCCLHKNTKVHGVAVDLFLSPLNP